MAVKELIDGEVPPDELQQSASLIYDSIHDLDGASSGPVYNQKRYYGLFEVFNSLGSFCVSDRMSWSLLKYTSFFLVV